MELSSKTYRPFIFPNGRRGLVSIEWCTCLNRRGPRGGVCGNCGCAIASQREEDFDKDD